ncbi:hypothetical protein Scep_024378 [Stephania cephalantha]|uniref:Uncharacterized protein n=1 Tax=Stephania cephalantha TaxID=152367 RepID=A0AAP0HTM2_9MAGN
MDNNANMRKAINSRRREEDRLNRTLLTEEEKETKRARRRQRMKKNQLHPIVGRSFTFKVKLTDYNLDQRKHSFTIVEICDEESTNDNCHNEVFLLF